MARREVRWARLVSYVRQPIRDIVTLNVQTDHGREVQVDVPVGVLRMMIEGTSTLTQYTEH
jgi:hypothetical protein